MTLAAHAVHQEIVPAIVTTIVSSVRAAGGGPIDMLVILESIIVGVLVMTTKVGGEEHVMEEVTKGVLSRVAELRLTVSEPAGRG